jgi:hypothetical protein
LSTSKLKVMKTILLTLSLTFFSLAHFLPDIFIKKQLASTFNEGVHIAQYEQTTIRRTENIPYPIISSAMKESNLIDCDAGENWKANTSGISGSWQSLAFGNGRFVALSQNGQLISSTDGENWTSSEVVGADISNDFWRFVIFGEDRFVALSIGNRVITSNDGITWSVHTAAESRIWTSATYGNGKFVALGSRDFINIFGPFPSNQIMSSADGQNWQAHTASELSDWTSITFGNGKFLAISPNRLMSSLDGENWESLDNMEGLSLFSITFGNGKFIITAERGDDLLIFVSNDGVEWESYQAPANIGSGLTYGNGRFVSLSNSFVFFSIDGINWNVNALQESNQWLKPTYGNNKFVTFARFSDRMLTSECTPLPSVPAAPSNLIAAVADGLADISFTQEDDGGIPILNYEYSLDGGTWASFESSPLMLKGLVNGQEFSISIRAVNAIGTSEASEVLTFSPIEDCFAGQYWTAHQATEANFWSSVTYGNGKFVAVSRNGQTRVMSSSNGIDWSPSSATEFNSWISVTFGNGRFVAVARDGQNRVMSSTDGVNWISGTGNSINASSWNAVTFGNGRFVAVATGGSNRIMSSTDGVNWDLHQAPETNSWWSVTYGKGKFVAVGSLGSNRIMLSADGINWTSHQAAASSFWFSVTYGHGKFVAVALDGETKVMSSEDGMNWTAQEVPESSNMSSVTFGLGRFVAVSQSSIDNGLNRVISSYDGENWTTYKAAEANSWFTVGYGGGKFVALSSNGTNRVMVSDCSIPSAELKAPTNIIIYPEDSKLEIEFTPPYDGVIPIINYEYSLDGGNSWITLDPASTASKLSITGLVNNTEYSLSLRAVNSEGPGLSSIPVTAKPEACFVGKVWDPKSAVGTSDWTSVIYSKGKFVAVADFGGNIRSMTSTDGYTWTAGQAPLGEWSSVTFGKDKFVAVAYDGAQRVMSSSDGINWTAHQAVENNFWNSVTFGQDKFVAVAASGNFRVMTSDDGVTWTGHQVPQFAWRSVTYDGKGRFVAVGESSVMSSSDGINWSLHTSPENNRWFSVTYGNGKFVAVAQTGTKRVMTSLDGINWTAHEGNATNTWTSISYGDGRFVAVSSSGNVMSSEDGINWVYPRTILRNQWYAVTYGDNKFVALSWYTFGVTNQVITSECPESSIPDFEEISQRFELSALGGTAWIDFDNDGDLDLASGNIIYVNDGAGSFEPLQTNLPMAVYSKNNWADFDNDGDLDVLLTWNEGDQLFSSIFRNNGNGQFSNSNSNLIGVRQGSVSWGDYDNDGDLDILLMGDLGFNNNSYIPITKLYRNDGQLGFTAVNTGILEMFFGSCQWADYDNDGDLDFVISGISDQASSIYSTKIYRNDGNDIFTDINASLEGLYDTSLEWGDYDNDGDLDLLLSGEKGGNEAHSRIYRNDGGDVFTSLDLGIKPQFAGMLSWGDFDNDGDLDIIVAGANGFDFTNFSFLTFTEVYRNEGNDVFSEVGLDLNGVFFSRGGWGDFDNDGDLDLAVSGLNNQFLPEVRIYKNNYVEKGGISNNLPNPPVTLKSTVNFQTKQVSLSWEASSDEETSDASISYNVFIREVGSNNFVKSPESDVFNGWRKLSRIGNRMLGKSFVWNFSEENLGKNFEWSVQAVDGAFAGSTFAAAAPFSLNIIPPCKVTALANNLTVVLDRNGQASITTRQADNGSFTDCTNGSVTITLSQTSFTCANLGSNQVTLTATDRNGNVGSTVFSVTVVDNLAPTIAKLPNTLRVSIEANSNYTVPDFRVTYPASDNCTVSTYTQTPVPGTVYTTAGNYPVVLTATDQSGNATSGTFDINLSVARPKGGGGNKSIDMNAVLNVSWNTPFAEIAKFELLIRDDTGKDRSLKVNWNQGDYDPLRPGLYQIQGKLYEEISFRMTSEPMMFVFVEQKPLPKDILISNNIIAKKAVNGFEIGTLTTIDPVDDIHTYSIDENQSVQLIQNKLVWIGKGEIPASLKVNVHSLDRSGQLISSSITLYREVDPYSILIYPNPAKTSSNILVQLSGESEVNIRVFDATGRLVYEVQEKHTTSFVKNLDLKGLASGVYHVVAQVDNRILTGRLVKDL